MTTAAELLKLVDCASFTAALREGAHMRCAPIHFNQWQKGIAELREAFEDDPDAKKDVANLSAQVFQSWHATMQNVHGSGWRGKLRVSSRKKRTKKVEPRSDGANKTVEDCDIWMDNEKTEDGNEGQSAHRSANSTRESSRTDLDVAHHVPNANTKLPQRVIR